MVGFIVGYIVIMLTSLLYEDPLFKWSGENIPKVQKAIMSSVEDTSGVDWKIWNIYTHMGGAVTQSIVLFILITGYSDRIETLVCTINYAIQIFWVVFPKKNKT